MRYGIAILGAGPAGISAAVNATILGKSVIWLGDGMDRTDAARAEKVRNYIGLPDVSGKELAAAFMEHAESFGLSPLGEVVTGVYKGEDGFTCFVGTESFDAEAVIICCGMKGTKTAEGEEKFVGKGISYCATCDGFLYKGKTVGVYLDDKKYEAEAKYICGLAGKAYLFPLYRGCGIERANVEVIMKKPTAFRGDSRLRRVVFGRDGRDVDGMFILKSALPFSTLAPGLELCDGHVKVDHGMRTNIEGLFAAGDCTGRPYQYAKAVGEGNTAAHSAVEYIDSIK
ncbi:MAG: NAD(P)/FAD-dependent oxidoreductase [Clostridia bacterium]|nr:NAD(P)/FAD-dependent oxidoreductase [Clostridia bacterium]